MAIEINVWSALRIEKRPMKEAVEYRVNVKESRRMTGTWLVNRFIRTINDEYLKPGQNVFHVLSDSLTMNYNTFL
jgi:hypothetical protein